jgi:formylglycine-generating enzyme required for sulfatase activity
MTTVYISSTYEDLKEYREVVYKALKKSGYDVIAMEDYVAADQRPVDKCLADIKKADVYVGIFAFRYGYVPPESHGNPDKLSITELEFRCAQSLSRPCLTFVVNENKAWPPMFDDARKAEDKGERINRLRQRLLTEKMASSFAEPYELASLVQSAIAAYLKDSKPRDGGSDAAQATAPVTWDIEKDGSPYPGLMHFTRKYAPVFFGREVEVNEILDRMRGPQGRFVIISGDSGVGKSSVVDAGILPRLEDGALPGGEACEAVRMVPGQSSQPFAALMTALGSSATRAGLRPAAMVDELKRAPETLTEQIRKIAPAGTNNKPLVLFLDQMEELFTAQDVEQSNRFLTALYQAAQEKALWVIATIRSDHLHYCHRHPEMLAVLKGPSHYPLGRVEPVMMADMIVKPALCAGLTISDTLARRIAYDTLSFRGQESSDSEAANLPLLAFILDQLFEKRADHKLSDDAYRTMGGIAGAIAEHVKAVEGQLSKISGTRSGDRLAQIFRSLVNIKSEDAPPTRNRPRLADLPPELRESIDVLVNSRLLHTEGEGEDSTLSISHEKLFEAWPALREFINANKRALIDQALLESRARRWDDSGRPWLRRLLSPLEQREFRHCVVSNLSKDYVSASWRWRTLPFCAAGGFIIVASFVGVGAWLNERASIQYAASIVLARSGFVQVPDPKDDMVEISAGTFEQGDVNGRGDPDERPVRRVTIRPFKIAKYEVTFAEYDRFVELTGSRRPRDFDWGRGKRPVVDVSWEDATAYAKWLSWARGTRYRLPTESEWEYAARAGTRTEYWWGDSMGKGQANCRGCGTQWDSKQTAPVGSFKANGFGLHDTAGNVREWVEDCWHANYTGAPTDGRAWKEENGRQCFLRVFRGGSWHDLPEFLRSWSRNGFPAGGGNDGIGFRLAQELN